MFIATKRFEDSKLRQERNIAIALLTELMISAGVGFYKHRGP